MELERWLAAYTAAVEAAFGPRIVCLGLQGSQARGEAGPESDIDAVLILDRLDGADLRRYRAAAADLPAREKLCGFVSGRDELLCWDPTELCGFYDDTLPLRGSLDFLLPRLTPAARRRAVLSGACGIYHACAHNLLHERDPALLPALQKALFFTLRSRRVLEAGVFPRRRAELLPLLPESERRLLEPGPWEAQSEALLAWAAETIRRYGGQTGDDANVR